MLMNEKYFAPKPELEPKIYAYRIPDLAEKQGLLKIGYTTQSVQDRVKQQLQTAGIRYEIVLEESAMRSDGSSFTDHQVHHYLRDQGILKVSGEWFACETHQVKAAIRAIRQGKKEGDQRFLDFPMRPEQAAAVEKTMQYFKEQKKLNPDQRYHFLWNAKMRFGKTFASYQLALKMGWKKVLILTFKPAVEKAREEDLLQHCDFEGWQFISKNRANAETVNMDQPFVCFGSFQDFLGKNEVGGIKTKNEWVHTLHRDAVIFDEYHYGAWREGAKGLFEEGEDENTDKIALSAFEGTENLQDIEKNIPITTDHYLYLSGTPFRAIGSGEFIEEQIFNWTYSDEQKAKANRADPKVPNPYAALPKMIMMTYQMPDHITQIAKGGEYDEFDLNVFFSAEGSGDTASFKYKEQVQKWLDLMRGSLLETTTDDLRLGAKKPALPFSDVYLLSTLNHTFWYLPSVAACFAMRNLLQERQNTFYQDYEVIVAAGTSAGTGVKALEPVNLAMRNPLETKTITLSCGKLTTGVSVKPRTGVFMLRNLKSPETYFQTAFRVQTPREIDNPDGKSPNQKEIMKKFCYVFDFAPNRALQQIADYSNKLSPQESNPEKKVAEFIQFLPVLSYDGSSMKEIDAMGILDMVTSGTTATLLARRRESALLVNVDTETLQRLLANERAMEALMKIEGFRALNQDLETIINKSQAIKKAKQEANERPLTEKEKKELTQEEKEYKSKRKEIQQKLIKFATRIPVFMYLTDNREHSLQDVITQLEPELFTKVTGLNVTDFELLVSLNIFNSTLMNDAVYKFKRYEDSSLEYTGINKHQGEKVGGYDTVITEEEFREHY